MATTWVDFKQLKADVANRVLLMLDGDAAGRTASVAIDDMLRARMPVTVISIGDGRQPDQLASDEMRRVVKRADTTRGGAPLRTAVSSQQLKEPTIPHE